LQIYMCDTMARRVKAQHPGGEPATATRRVRKAAAAGKGTAAQKTGAQQVSEPFHLGYRVPVHRRHRDLMSGVRAQGVGWITLAGTQQDTKAERRAKGSTEGVGC
jgi:hypothetical protein